MRKKIILFMTALCLMLYSGNLYVQASTPYKYCPYCSSELASRGENLGNWTVQRVFTDNAGKSVTCYENHNVKRDIMFCLNGHGSVWSEDIETVTHSIATCPYK